MLRGLYTRDKGQTNDDEKIINDDENDDDNHMYFDRKDNYISPETLRKNIKKN